MKTGEVVHIRVNAEDVMSCIDVVRQANVYAAGMSLAQVVRLALSGLLEAARNHGVIPRRDGFEYSDMVKPFLQAGRTGKKLQISGIIESAEAARAAVDATVTPVAISYGRRPEAERSPGADDLFDEIVRRKGRLIIRGQELTFKMQADPVNFSPEEQMELDKVNGEIQELDAKLEEL